MACVSGAKQVIGLVQTGIGGLASPAGAASVQGLESSTTEAIDAGPSEAGEAVLAALSEEDIAKIFENAQMLLEQRDASPRQSPLLQPAEAPEAVHAGEFVPCPLAPTCACLFASGTTECRRLCCTAWAPC